MDDNKLNFSTEFKALHPLTEDVLSLLLAINCLEPYMQLGPLPLLFLLELSALLS